MIKYSEIKGFKALGETDFGSHLYQWIEEGTSGKLKIILARAFDTETKIWSGYIMQGTKEITNLPDVVIETTCSMIKEAKRCIDFLDFLKGHNYYDDFKKEFKMVSKDADIKQ